MTEWEADSEPERLHDSRIGLEGKGNVEYGKTLCVSNSGFHASAINDKGSLKKFIKINKRDVMYVVSSDMAPGNAGLSVTFAL